MAMIIRGGKMSKWLLKPDPDNAWSQEDWGRAATLEARWNAMGVNEEDRRKLIPCAVWLYKFPGMQFHNSVMERLTTLLA